MTATTNAPTRGPRSRLLPPAPAGVPVLGNILDIQRDNVQAFMDAFRTCGDLVRFTGPLKVYLLAHPDHVRTVLQDRHKNYPRPFKVQNCLSTIVGDGLVAAEGQTWLQSRRLTQGAFHRQVLDGLAGTFVDGAREMLDGWQQRLAEGESGRSGGGPVLDVKSEMMHLSLTNLARALFRADLTEHIDELEPAVAEALKFTHRRMTTPVDPLRLPGKGRTAFRGALETIDRVLYDVIAQRRRGALDPAAGGGVPGGGGLVDLLMAAEDGVPDDRRIRDEVSGFFVAGHETVSTALSWTWYLLSLYPEWAERVAQEADRVLGDRDPTIEDLPLLVETTKVLQESMRLYPPIFVYMRCAAEEDEIGGYHVPAGQWMVVCPYVTHRHPDFWPNPEGFDPDRFTPELLSSLPRGAYLPFGAGPRRCIGEAFAMVQMPLVVAMVARRFRLSLVPGTRVVPEPAISLRPKDSMPMYLTPRTKGSAS